jgi:hypothetical protein
VQTFNFSIHVQQESDDQDESEQAEAIKPERKIQQKSDARQLYNQASKTNANPVKKSQKQNPSVGKALQHLVNQQKRQERAKAQLAKEEDHHVAEKAQLPKEDHDVDEQALQQQFEHEQESRAKPTPHVGSTIELPGCVFLHLCCTKTFIAATFKNKIMYSTSVFQRTD